MRQETRKVKIEVAAEAWIRLDGKPFRLKEWPMHRRFYQERPRRTLFKTGRQVAKSTTLANLSILECSIIPFFSTMFVSPSKEQTTRFSNSRVGKTMRYSPVINKNFLHTELSNRVFHKQFQNGSEMLFTYALDDPDRLRGPSTDRNMFDEVQDIMYDPVIMVGNETMSNSDYRYETYAGTPKTMENTIQYLWEISTQSEWVMTCPGCGKYLFIDSEKAIGVKGPICVKCGGYLNPYLGQWVDMAPNKTLQGFHISQLIMPKNVPAAIQDTTSRAHTAAEENWKIIKEKYEETPLATFRNEVLGVSDAIGTRLLTKEDLESLCVGKSFEVYRNDRNFRGFSQIVAGVDWSGGGVKGLSRTVLWIWGYRPADVKLVTLLYKIYPGTNPVLAHTEIAQTCELYGVKYIVGDAGEGALPNDLLRKKLGHQKVTQVQYGSHTTALKFNGIDRFLGDRTTLIDNYFMLLKKKEVEFGPLAEMKVAIKDILAEYEEVTLHGKKVWRHSPQRPDDCLHAGLFGWIAWKILNGDLRFWQM